MFSKDNRHYRRWDEIRTCRRHERLCIVAGVIVLGVAYGLLFAWRG